MSDTPAETAPPPKADGEPADGPHSFVVQHEVEPRRAAEYEAWLKRISPVAAGFPGHLGVQITAPTAGGRYVTVIRFASRADAERWIHAPERATLIDEARPLLKSGDRFTVKSGLDFWFTPAAAEAQLPVRWKQALVTWSAIFPIVYLVGGAVGWLAGHLPALQPRIAQLLLSTFLAVLLMVYLVMPRYTRLVRRWLFR